MSEREVKALFAKHHGVDRAYLNMILNGKRPVSDSIASPKTRRRARRKREARPREGRASSVRPSCADASVVPPIEQVVDTNRHGLHVTIGDIDIFAKNARKVAVV